MVQIGGKKKGGKKPKKQAKEEQAEEVFNIDITFINLFGFLKVSPPLNKESLDAKITELKTKMDTYIKEGEEKLKEEEEKLGEGALLEEEVEV